MTAKTNWKFGIKKKIIMRDDNIPYMIRYSIFSCPLFSIKIHNLLTSDDDCLHDHPWSFISIILKGGYVEQRVYKKVPYENASNDESILTGNDFFFDNRTDMFHLRNKKLYGAGSILYRPANCIHKLELFQPTWTFVITFKKVKTWGFFTPMGFVEWFKYRGGQCD